MRLTIKDGLHFFSLTFSLSLATFSRPNYSFAFDFLQHHVHIRHRRDFDKKGSCSGASIISTGNVRVRERRECISEASVTYVQVPFTIKGSLH